MKKLRGFLPLFVLTAAMLLITTALAAEEGTWGQLSWALDDEGLLTVSGEGPMDDFESNYSYKAWQSYYYSISALHIEEGVISGVAPEAQHLQTGSPPSNGSLFPQGWTGREKTADQYYI
ncbi:MAG: hypothetical protein K5922_06110 [Clostridiales bacterium]|nr:hypothetical protein [Clostridiales bacterium]